MKKILICDDSSFMRSIIRKTIESLKEYEVIGEAQDGIEAVSKYNELYPDIVFMDITMPKVDGLEALRKIMKYDKNAKVIMCSAMGQKDFINEAVKIGAKDFVVKPFTAELIGDKLKRL